MSKSAATASIAMRIRTMSSKSLRAGGTPPLRATTVRCGTRKRYCESSVAGWRFTSEWRILSRMTRIVIADDHAVVRKGLRLILADAEGIEIAGEAASADE